MILLKYNTKLSELIESNKGILTSKAVDENHIPREYLSLFVKKGLLERIERGIYLTPDAFDDEMYRFQLKYKNAIFSHENALFFHDLTDRDPLELVVTVPAGYNTIKLRKNGVTVYSVKKELHSLGIVEAKTNYGRLVKIYDKERTICDIIRSRNKIDIAILSDAIKRYTDRKDKNIPKLLRVAEIFNVQNILRKYLEVLL